LTSQLINAGFVKSRAETYGVSSAPTIPDAAVEAAPAIFDGSVPIIYRPPIRGLYMIGTDPSNIAGAASTAASGMVGALLTPYVSARLLTKPAFINWLVKAGPQMGKNPNNAKFHLGRLMEISSRDSQFREDAMEYVNAFGSALVDIHNMAVEDNKSDEVSQAEIGLSPAANSIIQSLTPDAAEQVQEAAR